MNEKKGWQMRNAIVSTTIVCLLLVIGLTMPIQAFAQNQDKPLAATIQILPDNYLAPNELETVNGIAFPANGSARIDLILPSGGNMDGVAYGSTDKGGAFTASFSAPSAFGDGYVRVTVGTIIVSALVHFTGAATGAIKIMTAQYIYTSKNTTITISSTTLITKNYIIDFTVLDPRNMETTLYFVLHNGIVYITYMFTQVGAHTLTAEVEGLNITESTSVTVLKGSSGGGGGGGGGGATQNITWIVSRSGFNLMIMLDTGTDFIQSGFITIVTPGMNQSKISISGGMATYTMTESGVYQFRYTGTDGYTTTKTYTYTPSVSITATISSTTNKITITVTLDGTGATGSVDIVKTADGTMDTAVLSSGTTTYTPDDTGSYVISYTYMGKKSSKSVTWSDQATVDTFLAEINGDRVTLSGVIIGKLTQKPMDGVTVTLLASFMQRITTTTDTDGSFTETVSIGDQGTYFSTTTLAFTAQVGTSKKTTTVSISKNFFAEYWWLVLGIIVLIVFFFYRYGFLHKMTKGAMGVPSMGRRPGFGQRQKGTFASPMGH